MRQFINRKRDISNRTARDITHMARNFIWERFPKARWRRDWSHGRRQEAGRSIKGLDVVPRVLQVRQLNPEPGQQAEAKKERKSI